MSTKDPLSYRVIGCAMEVYNTLGPGLLESVYEKALIHELQQNGLSVISQVPIEMNYKGVNLGEGLRLDLLVENSLIVELKSVEELKPIHYKQLLTYLKLTNKHIGLLINFNVNDFRDGIKRVINGYE
jgi:GxxExxY protein